MAGKVWHGSVEELHKIEDQEKRAKLAAKAEWEANRPTGVTTTTASLVGGNIVATCSVCGGEGGGLLTIGINRRLVCANGCGSSEESEESEG